jgi:hypothetical protein
MVDTPKCVFCTNNHAASATTVHCEGEPDFHFVPAGHPVLFGQIVDGVPHVTIHSDLSAEAIAGLMSGFMDAISEFDHIKENPHVLTQAIMKGMTGG